MMYVLNSPCFQYFCNFISIYGQNSVKILTNPYTWRHCYTFPLFLCEGLLLGGIKSSSTFNIGI